MKTKFSLSTLMIALLFLSSCDLINKITDKNTVGGEQSPMGAVGATVSGSSASIAGVSGLNATVNSLSDGISSFSGSVTVTNPIFKNLAANFPEVVVSGNTITANDWKFKMTKEGIEYKTGARAGVLAKYSSSIGDTYKIGNTNDVRTVTSKSSTDDFPYGFMYIKVMQIEEQNSFFNNVSIQKVIYYANHKYGLVGVKFFFNDGSSAHFPLFWSAVN